MSKSMRYVFYIALAMLLAAAAMLRPAAAAQDAADLTKLTPALDHRSLSAPARNTIYSCRGGTMGNASALPWVTSAGLLDMTKKPTVPGSITWPSQLSITQSGTTFRFVGNGLPAHGTGQFPIPRNSTAYQYDRNPNSIKAQSVLLVLPSNPTIASSPRCLNMGPIGIMLTGAYLFNALDADNRDAAANEIQDGCRGHPQQQGQYHYHANSPCFDQGNGSGHSPVIGVAFDGFPITGPYEGQGLTMRNGALDVCHGHVGTVTYPNGVSTRVYHYHLNNEFPYSLGCYRGTPAVTMRPGQ